MNCKRQFVEVDGFERMRHKPEIIARAVHQHEGGMSLSKVQNHLWQHDKVKVTRWTISRWTKKDTGKIQPGKRKTKKQKKIDNICMRQV